MSNRIQLALKATIRFHVAAIVAFTWFSLAKFVATEIAEQTKLFPQQDEGKRNFTFLYSPFLSHPLSISGNKHNRTKIKWS